MGEEGEEDSGEGEMSDKPALVDSILVAAGDLAGERSPGGAFTTVQVTRPNCAGPIRTLIELMGGASFQWKKSEIRNPFFAKCVLKLCKG